jgi:hypothetical protein
MAKAYKDLTDSQISNYLKSIPDLQDRYGFHAHHTKMMIKTLSFADNLQKLIVQDFSSLPYKRKEFLISNDDIKPIVYSNTPYEDNDITSLRVKLSSHVVEDYLKFYCSLWVVNEGRLQPISYFDDIEWQEDISPTMKQTINNDLTHYPQIQALPDGYSIKTLCLFQQSILAVDFHINENGIIRITNHSTLVDDLPVKNFS